jgi:phosphatidylinositol alpha-mannosyltransferase
MRIALVCPYSCSVPGGVQTQVLGLARAYSAKGERVALIAPGERTALAARLDEEALGGAVFMKVGKAVPFSVNGSRAPVSPWPSTMARTVSALRSFAPEVVHVHEPLVPGPSLAAIMAKARPTVATFHRAGADRAYRAYGHVLGRSVRRLEARFAVSEEARATAEACIGHLSGRVDIICNGVELFAARDVEPWPKSGPTIVFVGRHEDRKGLEVLLEAFVSIPAPARMWVIGDGPQTGRLRSQYASEARIEWLGPLDDTEKARRLAGADVLAAPSLGGESFGLVLLEAMAARTAVVASDLAGYRLAAGGAARLVPPGDPAALAHALRLVLYDEAERGALSEKGLLRAEECDMEKVADAYRDVFGRLLVSGRG